jgi:tetratricopeptide (TPR) repeat protein
MELKALAAQVYEQGVLAYQTLSDPTERARYVHALDAGEPIPRPAAVERLLEAEGRFREGQVQLEAGHLAQAHARFQEAVELYPLEGVFYAYLGHARHRLDPSRAEEALSLLERAVELSPTLDRAYLFLGHVYRALGDPVRAEEQYEKALACNPSGAEALAELKRPGGRSS